MKKEELPKDVLLKKILLGDLYGIESQLKENLDPSLLEKKISESFSKNSNERFETPSPLYSAFYKAFPDILKKVIQKDPSIVAEQTSQQLGSMVSSYVSHSIKKLQENIEYQINKQFPYERLLRKIKSKFFNVNEQDLILKEIQHFQIAGVVISEIQTGLVIEKNFNEEVIPIDLDVFSSLLNAIKSFSKDCISQEKMKRELTSLEFADFNIIIEYGSHFYISFIVDGTPRSVDRLRFKDFVQILDQSHSDFFKEFQKNSDVSSTKLKKDLRVMIQNKKMEEPKKRKRNRFVFITLFSFILFGSCLSAYHHTKEKNANSYLKSMPFICTYSLHLKRDFFGNFELNGPLPNQLYLDEVRSQIEKNLKIHFTSKVQFLEIFDIKSERTRLVIVLDQLKTIYGSEIEIFLKDGEHKIQGTIPHQNGHKVLREKLELYGLKNITTHLITTNNSAIGRQLNE